MRIATFNVNSVNARLQNLLAWLKEAAPDLVCLQELKCEESKFPRDALEEAGYMCFVNGQKSYNGVAILSKLPFELARSRLPGEDDDHQARYLEVEVAIPSGAVRLACLYCPNGNPIGTDKFDYKLRWMARLHAHVQSLLTLEEPLVLAGDWNIIPRPQDCYDANAWIGDALFQPSSRAAWQRLINLGLTDAFMAAVGEDHAYTFWDYQAGAWPKDHGIRIDHFVLSPQAADQLVGVKIWRSARGREKASDHVPVTADFGL
ncbi:exodeoxyribonuclease III [Candidatus Phycosocius spiralis]|uniref:Exodeoxyribonuclease III n=1 Tax=Candidatus Phycosocius spiralis TaxID=2815099 RepID=A0ABQ4PWV6_9PROT|nr:exodeoxyribonuclease III [Candidatus Phycosocius spiralis]GIU67541.1 exodeoxyribonuclease III [Candidatus Phycosocius spiralis]